MLSAKCSLKTFEAMPTSISASPACWKHCAADCPARSGAAATRLLATLYRRTGQFDEAVALLRTAVKDDGGSPWAHIELAKYYEHRIRDFATARDWSLQALDVAMRRPHAEGPRCRSTRLAKRRPLDFIVRTPAEMNTTSTASSIASVGSNGAYAASPANDSDRSQVGGAAAHGPC